MIFCTKKEGDFLVLQNTLDYNGRNETSGKETEMSYIDQIKEKARADKKTIVLPETNDKRTLIAASHILELRILL